MGASEKRLSPINHGEMKRKNFRVRTLSLDIGFLFVRIEFSIKFP